MKTLNPVRSEGVERVLVSAKFRPQGAGVPIQDSGVGSLTVVRNGSAGEYLITFAENYGLLVSAQATIQMAAATDVVPQFATYSATARTIILRALAAAVPTDIAANANNSISVAFEFTTTTVNPR
jgi:hypothetical protein